MPNRMPSTELFAFYVLFWFDGKSFIYDFIHIDELISSFDRILMLSRINNYVNYLLNIDWMLLIAFHGFGRAVNGEQVLIWDIVWYAWCVDVVNAEFGSWFRIFWRFLWFSYACHGNRLISKFIILIRHTDDTSQDLFVTCIRNKWLFIQMNFIIKHSCLRRQIFDLRKTGITSPRQRIGGNTKSKLK